ncbi:hypothetical protein SCHPADRAFT_699769 [Schizopora paradoxa]|uniref:BTB domain-containing protein n=1 Tax=Schizopora paradoxa TaxID=27342 RepID=A0A0H2R2T8_9AGAM|nr:hypothetical protein SCHPADRAFT_699769 [Schizopora paradoxa]
MGSRRGSERREEDLGTAETPQRHDVLWFPDGNVVLATDVYLFKVYKGLLSMQSSVFRDMFDLEDVGTVRSGDEAVQDMYDGAPLVTLVGDKGEDVVHLLRAVFEHNYHHRDDRNTPLDVVTALLDLSTKYDFKELRKDAVFQISQQYPMVLEEFDDVNDAETPMFGHQRSECDIPLLKAAFKAGIDALLPILFLSGACRDISSILRMSGSMDSECLNILLEGREPLVVRINMLLMDLPDNVQEVLGGTNCQDVKKCKKAAYEKLSYLAHSYIYHIQGYIVVDCHLRRICQYCRPAAIKYINKKREEIWEDIPSLFGYPGWDDARTKLKELLGS